MNARVFMRSGHRAVCNGPISKMPCCAHKCRAKACMSACVRSVGSLHCSQMLRSQQEPQEGPRVTSRGSVAAFPLVHRCPLDE